MLLPAGALKDLTRKLREAAFRANGGKPVDPLTETVRNEWHKNNPCMSREKLPLRYAARKFVKDLNVSAAWDAVFRGVRHSSSDLYYEGSIEHFPQ